MNRKRWTLLMLIGTQSTEFYREADEREELLPAIDEIRKMAWSYKDVGYQIHDRHSGEAQIVRFRA